MIIYLEDNPRMKLLIQMGMDIFKAVDTCCQIGFQKGDTSFHPHHYSMSVSATIAPCSRSCPVFTFSWETVNITTAVTLRRKAQKMQAVCSFLSFFPVAKEQEVGVELGQS